MKGNKRTLLVLLAIAALLCVTLYGLLQLLDGLLVRYSDPAVSDSAAVGIAATGAVGEVDPENRHTVVFPAWQEGRDAANAAVYDTAPFTVTLALPEGWLITLPPVEARAAGAPWTAVQLVDAAGVTVGEMGFEPVEKASLPTDALRLEYPAADVYVPEPGVCVQLRMDPAAVTQVGLDAIAQSITAAPVA